MVRICSKAVCSVISRRDAGASDPSATAHPPVRGHRPGRFVSPRLVKRYAKTGCLSIAPEKLLGALSSIRNEHLLKGMLIDKQLGYTLLRLEPVLHIMTVLMASLLVQVKDQNSNARADGLRHVSIQRSGNCSLILP